ncbi:MAG: hypothetical protein ACYCZX_11790 [Rhodospirillaceae bacterium]
MAASGAVVAVLLAWPGAVSASETRTYVISWFSQAAYSQEDDCPGGQNPEINQQYLKNLAALGLPPAKIEELAKKQEEGEVTELRDLMNTRARINGEPANPFTNPAAVADPKLKASAGKYAYGFNLDGKGERSPGGFEDPETHEKGINHELIRALGCVHGFRGSIKDRPTYWAWGWGQLKDSQPAWLMRVSAESFTKDGDVVITFDRALEHLRSNIDGSPRPDTTYRIDPDPRSHNEFHGRLKDGVISLPTPGNLHLLQNPLVAPELRLSQTHFRLKVAPDGTISGLIGGYQPWSDLYFAFAAGGPTMEICIVGDIPGLYYLLKRHADGEPDPKTGENTAISATYYIETVPAFIVPPETLKRAAGRGENRRAQ